MTDRGYLLHKSRPSAEAALANLFGAARSMPYAVGQQPGVREGTVVVVGAGPSLDATIGELPRLRRMGASIFTVNTALPKVAAVLEPDVVIAREIVDVSQHMAHPARLRVLDIGANARVWEAAQRAGPCAWFVPGVDQYFDLAVELGVRPLFGGVAAVTSAVALAYEWGARRIVLMGCDLALGDDGRSYADGTAFGGQRATIGDDGMAVNGGEGFAAKQAAHEAAGIKAYPEREVTCVVERWGGGAPLRTTTQWIDQVSWLANFAGRHPEVTCVDATGGGARKGGWIETEARALHFDSAPVMAHMVEPRDHGEKLRRYFGEQVERLGAISTLTMHPLGRPLTVPGVLRGVDFVELVAARGVALACEQDVPVREKIAAVYGDDGAFCEAAGVVLERVND